MEALRDAEEAALNQAEEFAKQISEDLGEINFGFDDSDSLDNSTSVRHSGIP